MAALVLVGIVQVPPASAAPVTGPGVLRLGQGVLRLEPGVVPVVPPLVTETWDGSAGVDPFLTSRWRKAVADVAELHAVPEIRAAAAAALAVGTDAAVLQFAQVTQPQMQAADAQRRKEVAARNLTTVRGMVGTGGAWFNAEVDRVLKGTDADREAFLAYGADIARARDEKTAQTERERKGQLRDRVRLLAGVAAPESHLKAAADAALAGDDAAVAVFWATGYFTAANADAAEREQYLKDLEARNKAAEELSELAQKAARASQARTRLLAAHGDAVHAVQRAANAMAGAANSARSAQRILATSASSASKATELTAAKNQTAVSVQSARTAAEQARVAATVATAAADTLIETGLTYGAEWSLIVAGMKEAADAAVGAADTAAHAIDATIATNAAQSAQAKAQAAEQQAVQWRLHAQQHAAAAAKLAAAAKRQADAAKTAAARTKVAREKAQAAEARAWAAAERVRQQKLIAQAEAQKAKEQRVIAERERAAAAAHRAEAERQAAIARNARANADSQAAIASQARGRAAAADDNAGKADERAWAQEGTARQARDAAMQAEKDEQTAKARAQATRAWAASTASGAEKEEAQRQADEAGRQAGIAGGAARSARSSANTATGAAVNARTAAGEAARAADRAWAAAEAADAAAARADAAADKAEADAKVTHAARMQADRNAAQATTQEIRAADAASAAVRLSQQAADEAVQSLRAADRTREEAQAATTEAVAAAHQADIAVTASIAARTSSAGIAEPANTAIAMVSPFTGADIDADFVTQVAEQARTIGAEQAAAAQARANEAITAATRAATAAQNANAQVKPAYDAAAAAAASARDAARSAAEAKQAAAQAAADGAAARTAAASAGRADAQAHADALAARQAADEAANDAAIAGRSAAAAQRDADAANSAASAAEADAAAARGAATRAEADAADAAESAASAQEHADSAATAANSALQHAIEAASAAERAEEAERQRANEALAAAAQGQPGEPPSEELLNLLTPEERAQFLAAQGDAGADILDFIQENAVQLFLDLSGIGDLKSCILDGNIVACLWTLVGLLPVGKIFGAMADMAKLAPKVLKFLDKVRSARKKIEELTEAARRKSGCPIVRPPNSFLPGTPVLLADGTTRPIEDIVVGDTVLAGVPLTGGTRAAAVTDTITSVGQKSLVDVTVDIDGAAGDATADVTATDGHPFWVAAPEHWADAVDLTPGQWLRTASGTWAQITAVHHRDEFTRVHNLTVADLHTYHVVVGGMPVLVHNVTPISCGTAPNFPSGPIPTRKPASVGNAAGNHKFRDTFYNANPGTKGNVVVHHAVEQQVLKKYPGLFTPDELHSLDNLRGIPKGQVNSNVHLSTIRLEWNKFYKANPSPTKQDVLNFATEVDDKVGHWFTPRVR